MNPIVPPPRLHPRNVGQQLRTLITEEIEPVSPDLRRHAAEPTAAAAPGTCRNQTPATDGVVPLLLSSLQQTPEPVAAEHRSVYCPGSPDGHSPPCTHRTPG